MLYLSYVWDVVRKLKELLWFFLDFGKETLAEFLCHFPKLKLTLLKQFQLLKGSWTLFYYNYKIQLLHVLNFKVEYHKIFLFKMTHIIQAYEISLHLFLLKIKKKNTFCVHKL